MGKLALFLLCVVSAACSGAEQLPAAEAKATAFGIWRTRGGHTVELRPDFSYRYCDGGTCFEGKARREGATGIVLLGFLDHPATGALRRDSGFDEANNLRGEMFRQVHDYDFTDNIGDDAFRERRCRGRPCHHMGDRSLVEYTFVQETQAP